MKVRMLVDLSGSHDGVAWPRRGGIVDLPDGEGADLCASRMAEPVADPGPAPETATAPEPEKRTEPAVESKPAPAAAPEKSDATLTKGKAPVKQPAKDSAVDF